VESTVNVLMTKNHVGVLLEVTRVLATAVTHGEVSAPLREHVSGQEVLGRLLVLWFNTLNPQLQERTSSLLHTLMFYSSEVATALIRMHAVPLANDLLSSHMDDAHPDIAAIEALLRMLDVITTLDDAAESSAVAGLVETLVRVVGRVESSEAIASSVVVLANMGARETVGTHLSQDASALEKTCDILAAIDTAMDVRCASWWLVHWCLQRVVASSSADASHQLTTSFFSTNAHAIITAAEHFGRYLEQPCHDATESEHVAATARVVMSCKQRVSLILSQRDPAATAHTPQHTAQHTHGQW